MVVFAASQAREDDGIRQFLHLGTDVVASNNPAPMGPDGGLHVLMPGGRVRKLFPLPQHETVPGLIDTPLRQLHKGAVCEPHVSNDGTRVYFTWFHDQTWKRNGGGWQNQELSYKGSDLYSIDLAPLIADPTVSAASLPVKRLTSKEYDGFHKDDVRQTLASRAEFALNPSAPGFANQLWGTCNLHMIEMETEHGLKAVFCSDRSRLANSNSAAGKPNHNFNLFVADILPDGSLGTAHQAQYYTTTSALSPEPMRDGFCFSYQSSTDSFRRWDLQTVTSGGRWGPLLGYAQASELYHFGTLITKEVGGDLHDWFIGVKYYNLNNGGFGQLHLLDVDDAGINEFVQHPGGHTEAEQILVNLTPEVTIRDLPSPQSVVGGKSVYVGKMSTPRAGRMGGEFLAAYTPTSANRWVADADGNVGEFDSHIVYRPDTDPFSPQLPYDPQTGSGLAVVVDEATGRYNLAWPTPVLSWMDRHGTPTQSTSPSATDPNSAITRGMPWADIGTSAIWNTDIRPYDCYFGSGNIPYHPNELSANDEIDLDQSIEGLRYVQDQSDFCQYLLPETVLGIQINLTSNRPDWDSTWNPAYETDATRLNWSRGEKEASRILGVYDVRTQNVADQSFIAQIPSDVPFDFHLLDSRYGMKLIDVRSWHALQPRESRMDCGGCHQHERGFGIPFAGTEASARTPLDLVRQTLFYAYDPDCKPTIQVTPDATVEVPEWTEDIWPEFDQHCSACHDVSVSTDAAALAALDYADEESAYNAIKDRRYASSVLGALGVRLLGSVRRAHDTGTTTLRVPAELRGWRLGISLLRRPPRSVRRVESRVGLMGPPARLVDRQPHAAEHGEHGVQLQDGQVPPHGRFRVHQRPRVPRADPCGLVGRPRTCIPRDLPRRAAHRFSAEPAERLHPGGGRRSWAGVHDQGDRHGRRWQPADQGEDPARAPERVGPASLTESRRTAHWTRGQRNTHRRGAGDFGKEELGAARVPTELARGERAEEPAKLHRQRARATTVIGAPLNDRKSWGAHEGQAPEPGTGREPVGHLRDEGRGGRSARPGDSHRRRPQVRSACCPVWSPRSWNPPLTPLGFLLWPMESRARPTPRSVRASRGQARNPS